jgi:tetratricopeptide (TPR) repeat protein
MLRCLLLVTMAAVLAVASGCSSCRRQPDVAPEAYREAVTAFYTGLAAMQTTQEVLARSKFDRVVALTPHEPAGWANLGLLLLRQQEIEQGAEKLTKAAELAPDSAAIQRLLALAESRRGNLNASLAHWRRALEIDPDDLEAAYSLALETERQGGADHDAEAQRLLEQLVARRGNLAARLEYLRLAAKRGDVAALRAAAGPLSGASKSWSPQAQEQLKAVVATAEANPRAAATRVAFLKNFLLREPIYRIALAEVTTPREEVGQPLTRFLRMKNPDPQPAPADDALRFSLAAVPGTTNDAAWAGPVSLTGEGNEAIAIAAAGEVRIAGTPIVAACKGVAGISAVAAADLNYDFRTDLIANGPGGTCVLQQQPDGRFSDVTAAAKLPDDVRRAPAVAVWPADIDTDGDLDLVLARQDASPLVLRNNGDGTFAVRDPFAMIAEARAFVWADFDGEGVPDAAFVDASGTVRVFLNQRAGGFEPQTLPMPLGEAVTIAAAELNGDAILDVLILRRGGGLTRLSRSERDGQWHADAITREEGITRIWRFTGPEPGGAQLLLGDLDNNGAVDVIVGTSGETRVLLGGPAATFVPLAPPLKLDARAVADVDGDGRLDVVGLVNGQPSVAKSKGAKAYHWQVLRPRATTVTGDQRINTFGIGGEVELRSGLHAQRQPITSPVVHFGLGEATRAEVVRIGWPNGALQSEFNTEADQSVKATQRLKGSCPWLFAWNGREMAFVTDLIWRSPLGLRINAQATADVLMTEDWVKIRGDQLAARDGAYDLRITAELWETHFFDLVSLMTVDHPAGTEVFVDERFAIPAPALKVIPTGPVQSFASVHDDRGRDVSDLANARDSRHIDFAGRGRYQGITRPHYVEIELPDAAPRTGPLWLIAQGWVHPTDSSINVAVGQGAQVGPEGLSLHVADRTGQFHLVRAGLGFPSGKDKTVLIDLTGLLPATGPRRVRLATNLEIFWDRLGWAVGRPDVPIEPRRLDLLSAELAFRGYSATAQADASSPERPRYVVESTASRWRDLEGYYTRFGDVRPLVSGVDDRYVIMNAGDELRLRFEEAPPPRPGMVRDFVAVGDGWVKDGDYNTSFSRTVLPLPTHRSVRYDTPPRDLEDDPIYRRHAADFAEYHTRYVTAAAMRDALCCGAGASDPRSAIK